MCLDLELHKSRVPEREYFGVQGIVKPVGLNDN